MTEEQAKEWYKLKATEEKAVAKRRQLEEEILKNEDIATPRTVTKEFENLKVKIAFKLDKKVDAEKLQSLAVEYGLVDRLPLLFRWKPEINKAAWDNEDEQITRCLSEAITVKPVRPYFTITKEV